MSSLMVSNLELMMLEFAVQKLFVPKASIFDSVIMKKTTVMFRMLNCDWTSLNPHRTDYAPYRGSNLEEEDFHGGKSVVFAVPSERLREKVKDVDMEINVRKEVSKYFEMEACQNVGTAMVNVDDLFNGIVKELRERRELNEYLSGFHKRQPISRSLKGTYKIVDSEEGATGATITVYVRLSHLGKSVVTEIEFGGGKRRDFYAQEESNESHPYGCKELKPWQLESGCWGGSKLLLPPTKGQLSCRCDSWARMTKPADQLEESEDEVPRDRLDDCDGRGGAGEEPLGSRDNGNGSGKKDPKRKKVSKGGSARRSIARSPTGGGKKRSTSGESPRPSQADNKVNKGKERSSVKRGSEVSKADGHRGLSAGVPVERGDSPRPRKGPASAKKPRAGTEAAERTDKGGEKTVDSKDQRIQDRSKAKSADAASNRRLQLRRRQRGVITVGLGDREKKICHEAPETRSTSPSTCPCVLQTSTSIQPTVCSNIYSHYCCPTISSCKSNCSPRTSITRNSTMYGCFVQPSPTLVPEMTIYTN